MYIYIYIYYLALCVRAKISLEAERVDDGQVGLHHVQRRAGPRTLRGHVATTAREHLA